jgi:hypothetical protein
MKKSEYSEPVTASSWPRFGIRHTYIYEAMNDCTVCLMKEIIEYNVQFW